AGAEAAADAGRGQRGQPRAAPAVVHAELVADPAVLAGAVAEILLGLLDAVAGDDDAGVAGGADGLHLGDGDRALVEVGLVLGGHVAPAAGRVLGLVAVLGGPLQDGHQLLAAADGVLLADQAGQEQQAEAVLVHVAPVLAPALHGVADQPIGLGLAHDEVGALTDLPAEAALAQGAPLHEHGQPSDGGHGHRVGAADPLEAAVGLLLLDQPAEALLDGLPVLLGDLC